MGIQRGEIPATARNFFGINENDKRIPNLISDTEVMEWGGKIIKGESERMKKGLSPFTNPTIAVVKVRYENYADSYSAQQTIKKTNARYLLEISELRKTADEIIQIVWNEVEVFFNDLTEELKREKASEYGINYVFRKNELVRLKIPEVNQTSLFA